MSYCPHFIRFPLLAGATLVLAVSSATAGDPMRVVFQNGRSIPLSSLSMAGGKLVTTVSGDGFTQGQAIALESIDHVYGEKPEQINPAIALLLMGKAAAAEKLLEPILAAQKITAKIPGNYWIEAAHAALVAYAVQGNSARVTEIGKEISDATPVQGIDPFVMLGKALLMSSSARITEREAALNELITDDHPADLCAYASFYRAEVLKEAKRSADAPEAKKQDQEILEAYLAIPCLYPTGGMILNGTAELKAAEILASTGRHEGDDDRQKEVIALLNSSIRHSNGTVVVSEANKRLDSTK